MIESLLIFLQENVLPLGALGVFLASIIEEIVAPIPSALIMTTAGFLFISGPIDYQTILNLIFLVALPTGFGVALGSLVVFYVAWFGGKPAVEKFGRWIGLSWTQVEELNKRISHSRRDEAMIIGVRILPIVPSVAVSAFCGFLRMKLWKYLLLTFTGMFTRGLILGALGWQLGNLYYKYADLIARLEDFIFIAILFILFIIFSCLICLFLRKYPPTHKASADK